MQICKAETRVVKFENQKRGGWVWGLEGERENGMKGGQRSSQRKAICGETVGHRKEFDFRFKNTFEKTL